MAGCASIDSFIRRGAAKEKPALAVYSGPKAKIVVADFEVQAPKAASSIGAPLRKMLIAGLTDSRRFIIVERQPQSGPGVTGEDDKPKPADLIITATLVEFEPQASGGKAGIGGGGGAASGILGGLLGVSMNKAHMAVEIRVVGAVTSTVLAAGRVQGQASDNAARNLKGAYNNWESAAGLTAYANTPMEKAMHECIIEAVRYISATVPQSYYRYPNGKT